MTVQANGKRAIVLIFDRDNLKEGRFGHAENIGGCCGACDRIKKCFKWMHRFCEGFLIWQFLPDEKPCTIGPSGTCALQGLRHIKDVHLLFLYGNGRMDAHLW
jgi:hypothetical protein